MPTNIDGTTPFTTQYSREGTLYPANGNTAVSWLDVEIEGDTTPYKISLDALSNRFTITQTILGVIKPKEKGTHDPSGAVQYALMDYVKSGSTHYLYISDTPTSPPTPIPLTDTTRWTPIVSDGVTPDTSSFLTQTTADARYPLKTATDPYPGYLTPAEAAALYSPIGDAPSGGLQYNLNLTTTFPAASGQIRFNNAAIASVTEISLHKSDRNSASMTTVLDALAVGNRIKVSLETDEEIYAWFTVSGAIVDSTNNRTIPVTFVSSSGTFTAGEVAVSPLQIQGMPSGGGGASGIQYTYSDQDPPTTAGQIRTLQTGLDVATEIAINSTDAQGNSSSDVFSRLKTGAIISIAKDGSNWIRATVTTDYASGSVGVGSVVTEGAIANGDTVFLSIVSDAPIPGPAGSGSTVRLREVDGTPNDLITDIIVPNGSLSIASGIATLQFATAAGLTANQTFFIRPDGNDTNNGLTDTPSGAFLTIQRYYDIVATLQLNRFTVTGQLADGTYNTTVSNIMHSGIGVGEVVISGNATTPSNVHIIGTADLTASGALFLCRGTKSAIMRVQNLKYSSPVATGVFIGILSSSGAYLEFSNVDCGLISNANGKHLRVEDNATLRAVGNYVITGGASNHYDSVDGLLRVQSRTVAISNSPVFGTFADCNLGKMIVNGNTYSGTPATGIRFNVRNGGQMFVNGAGLNYLPGSSNGVVDSNSYGHYA